MADDKLDFDLESPTVVSEIDEALLRLIGLRDYVAWKRGTNTPCPVIRRPQSSETSDMPVFESKGPLSGRDVAELVRVYRTDPRSPIHAVRHRTKLNYDAVLKRLLASELGNKKLADLRKEDFERAYEMWKDGGRVALAHSVMTILRLVVSFGATVLEDAECLRLTVILHKMRLEVVKPRDKIFSAEWANGIRQMARELGSPSIALAQAFQFDCKLHQTDVIGEWVPNSAPGISDVTTIRFGKWLSGIHWGEVDADLILRHVTSRRQELVEIDLKNHSAVLEELAFMFPEAVVNGKIDRSKLPAKGPIIVSEKSGFPYLFDTFRRNWRTIATAAGVPKDVENRDSSYATAEAAAEAAAEKAAG